MSVNFKQMYLLLSQQLKSLQGETAGEVVNEIPKDFNQTGWDTTIEKAELMVVKMKELREEGKKRNRMTPQFYRSIYNRALIAISEIDKVLQSFATDTNRDIDYQAECTKLMAEIQTLTAQKAAEAAANAQAEAEAAKVAAEQAAANAQASEPQEADKGAAAEPEAGKGKASK